MNTINQVTPQSAGALTFSPDGVLFLGDNKLGAVFAFETERGQAPASLDPFLFESIDEKIASSAGRNGEKPGDERDGRPPRDARALPVSRRAQWRSPGARGRERLACRRGPPIRPLIVEGDGAPTDRRSRRGQDLSSRGPALSHTRRRRSSTRRRVRRSDP